MDFLKWRGFLLSITSLIFSRPSSTFTFDHPSQSHSHSHSLLLSLTPPRHGAIPRSSFSTSPISSPLGLTTDDIKSNCDVLVNETDFGAYGTEVHNIWNDFRRCPANETVKRCTFTFRGKGFLVRRYFKLCVSTSFIRYSLLFYNTDKVEVTVFSGKERHELVVCLVFLVGYNIGYNIVQAISALCLKISDVVCNFESVERSGDISGWLEKLELVATLQKYTNRGYDLYSHVPGPCARPNEDMRVIYESKEDKNLCSDDFKHKFINSFVIEQRRVYIHTMTLMSIKPCYRPSTLFSNTGYVLSGYEPGWLDPINFCEGMIYPNGNKQKLCFTFVHFEVYPGGAQLEIGTAQAGGRKKKLVYLFDYNNRVETDQVCIDIQDDYNSNIYLKVVPGADSQRKYQHAFVLRYVTYKIERTSVFHDNGEDRAPAWWLVILMIGFFLCFTCCCYRCCIKKKDAARPNNTATTYRMDAPTIHPAFVNVSRYTATQPALPMLPRNMSNRERIGVAEMQPSIIPPVEDSVPDPDTLPSYDSLFPGNR